MDILMGLVIAMFIITAAYVGFHASHQEPEAKGHNIPIEAELLETKSFVMQEQTIISKSIV